MWIQLIVQYYYNFLTCGAKHYGLATKLVAIGPAAHIQHLDVVVVLHDSGHLVREVLGGVHDGGMFKGDLGKGFVKRSQAD